MKIAKRMDIIQPFHVMALLDRAKQMQAAGRDVIHLEVGEPDFPTPGPILEAGIQALRDGHTHYTPAAGLPALREAIAAYYGRRFGVDVSPQRIIVTPGASGALGLATTLLFDPSERVMLADPGYPCNANFLHAINALPDWVPTSAATGFQLTARLVEQHWRDGIAGVLVASPSNPTGTVIGRDALRDLHAVTRERDAALIVDEIYQGLTYEGADHTALALENANDDVVVINSFSKYFGMTGWRLGWLVAPEAVVAEAEKLAQNFYLAAPTPSQYAALAAFSDETVRILEERRLEMKQRRDFLLSALPAIGFRIPVTPAGAFYIYCDISAVTGDSFGFCLDVLEKTGVAITPGKDFGRSGAARHVRIAYTAPVPRLKEAVERLDRYMREIRS